MIQKNYETILEELYKYAENKIKKDDGNIFIKSLDANQREWILKIVEKSESHKAVVTALTTSLVKK